MTPTLVGVPNQEKTPRRTFRISDAIYEPAQKRAEREDTTVTAVVVEALKEYGAEEED